MNTNHKPRAKAQRQYERTLYAYSSALERGDFATVGEILAQASVDPVLERLILDLNAAYRAELTVEAMSLDATETDRTPTTEKETLMLNSDVLRQPHQQRSAVVALLITLAAIVVVIFGVLWANPTPLLFLTAVTPTLAPTATPTRMPAPSTAGDQNTVPITAANVSKLALNRILGRGYFSGGFAWAGSTLAVSSPLGIFLFNTDDLAAPPRPLAYAVNQLGFSADGKTLITATMNTGNNEITGTIARWDVATLRQLDETTIKLGTDGAWFADFVADNTLLPYEIDGKLRFYNVLTDEIDIELNSAAPLRITGIAFSPDGSYVAAGTVDNRLHIWEVANPDREKFILSDAKEQIYSLTFTPDSQSLLTADNRTGILRQWNLKTGKQISLATVGGSVFDLKFSPTGKQYASANQDGTITIYNAETNIPFIKLTGHPSTSTEGRAVARLAFNDDGTQLASVGDNGLIKVWDMRGGQEIAQLDSQSVCPDQIAYSADGQRLLALCEDSVQVWDVAKSSLLLTARTELAGINSASLSADGKFLAFEENRGVLQVWDIDANKRTLIHEILREATSTVTSGGGTFTSRLAFSSDGKWLAFAHAFDSLVWVLDLTDGTEQSIKGHTQAIYALRFSPDGRTLFSTSADGSSLAWDVTTQTLGALREGAASPITAAQFSPDSKLIAVTHEDGTLELLDAQTLTTQTTLRQPSTNKDDHFYSSLAFTPDSKLLASFVIPIKSTGDAEAIIVWDVGTAKQVAAIKLPIAYPRSMAITPDGKQLAVSAGGVILFYTVGNE
ncbi:MAG: WD40 repeat domain-containing protein [Anaerolineae bacterium]|nr:WD40 repeat domain-containing protein [Anaerolineae bacterium]